VGLNALVANFDKVFPLAEGQSFLWTNLNAGRWQTILQSGFMTEDTLLDDRSKGTGVTVGRNIERASDHAVSATDTDAAVVDNGTFFGLGVGVDKTGTETRWLSAMITLHFAIDRIAPFLIVTINHSVGTFIGAPFLRTVMEGLIKNRHIIERQVGVRQLLFFVAGSFAAAATDTTS
jgi:hypothetical protein